jgi:Flp pilus assembly protein TadD
LHGWLKLGTAQLRARRLDDAGKAFRAALEIQPKHPEALNGLGMVNISGGVGRTRSTISTLRSPRANLSPALLNSAVVHQQLGSRQRQWLAIGDASRSSPGRLTPMLGAVLRQSNGLDHLSHTCQGEPYEPGRPTVPGEPSPELDSGGANKRSVVRKPSL